MYAKSLFCTLILIFYARNFVYRKIRLAYKIFYVSCKQGFNIKNTKNLLSAQTPGVLGDWGLCLQTLGYYVQRSRYPITQILRSSVLRSECIILPIWLVMLKNLDRSKFTGRQFLSPSQAANYATGPRLNVAF